MRAPPVYLFAIAALLGSSPAWACAVCGAGEEPNSGVFVVMSVVISLVPLAMMGAIGYWVFRSARRARLTPPPPAPRKAGERV
jgi:hypothetical protein